jgi:ankyrin repeat protein
MKIKIFMAIFFALSILISAPEMVQSAELHDAARAGDLVKVRQLLEQGVNINIRGNHQYTPLHEAAESGHSEVVKLLLEKGADVNAKTEYRQTPLHRAAGWGRTEVADLLIQRGADLNARDWVQDTPLHVAAEKGKREVAALLIRGGADVNARNDSQSTPLHKAASGYSSTATEVAALLIEKGANLNARDHNQDSPVMVAEKFKRLELVALFRKTDSSSARQDFDAKLQKVAREGFISNDNLRVIVGLSRSLTPRPAVPPVVEEEMVKGKAAFKLARRPEEVKEAEEHFRKASILAPWLPEPYFNLAVAQEKQYKWDDAKGSFENYLIAAPEAKDAPAVKQKMAELDLQKKRWEDFGQEVNIGVILYKKGPKEYIEAIQHWKRAIELCPEHPKLDQVYYNLGDVYMNQGNLDDAYKTMQKAFELNPNTDVAARYTNMGVVLERRGDRAKACTYYKKGCDLGSKVSCGNYSKGCQ